jgi:hypothetical protein
MIDGHLRRESTKGERIEVADRMHAHHEPGELQASVGQ